MITNVFDYKQIIEQQKAKFEELRKEETKKRQELIDQTLMGLNPSAFTDDNVVRKAK